MEHEVKIINNSGVRTEVVIDGYAIQSCSGYTVSQSAGEIPRITIEMIPPILMEIKGTLAIDHLRDLARIMDEQVFNEFCVLWRSLHGDL